MREEDVAVKVPEEELTEMFRMLSVISANIQF